MSITNKKAGNKWKATRHDKFYHLAKEQGFRSRAAFKLIQLNKTHNFLGGAKACLDLCAAPGGWLQVAAKHMPVPSIIVGVDLLPIRPIKNVITLVEDITSAKCRAALTKEFQGWQVDVVLHDGSPNVGGSTWEKDAYMQNELVVMSLKLATEFLRSGGTFVTKVFRSADYNSVLWLLKQFFRQCEVTKPQASRSASAEIFIVCKGYLAPKKIDPKLLDPAHVFKHIDVKKPAVDVFNQKQKKFRGGYEDDAKQILHKEVPVTAFIDAPEPIALLGSYNSFIFNDEAKPYLTHTATTAEIRALCSDLKVLGKSDFKALLRWRGKMRAYRKELLKAENEAETKDTEMQTGEGETEEDAAAQQLAAEEENEKKLDEDLEGLRKKALQGKKREKKQKNEAKQKLKKKMELNAHNPQGMTDTPQDQQLFSLSHIKDQRTLEVLHANTVVGDAVRRKEDKKAAERKRKEEEETTGKAEEKEEEEDVQVGDSNALLRILDRGEDEFSEDEEEEKEEKSKEDEGFDSEDERLNAMESEIDTLYSQYVTRRRIVVKKQREKLGLEGEDAEVEEDENGERILKVKQAQMRADSDEEGATGEGQEEEDGEGKTNPLLVTLGTPSPSTLRSLSAQEKASRWFERDVFGEVEQAKQKAKTVQETADKKKAMVMYGSDSEDSEEEEEEGKAGSDDEKGRWAHEKEEKTGRGSNNTNNSSNTHIGKKRGASALAAEAAAAEGRAAKARRAGEKDERVRKEMSALQEAKRKPKVTKGTAADDDDEARAARRRGELIEEVPLEEYDDDTDAQAEVLALGTAMIRKKNRTKIINDAYNRFAFNDPDLPDWFEHEESRHNKRMMPVTKNEVDDFKAKLLEINTRPIRKIAEAVMRKKVKTAKRWTKIKAAASNIAGNEEMAPSEKLKSIEKLYQKRDKRKEKKDRIYVVAKRAGGGERTKNSEGKQGRVKHVDTRMKKEVRAMRRKRKETKGKPMRKKTR